MQTPAPAGMYHQLVLAIAEREATTPIELPPLGNSIDLEALERFLGSTLREANVEFRYLGWTITVRNDGHFTITETHYE